ncbi:MAG: DNA cytosine methyltransferase [Candidatus Methylumidiphilus sp.]
MSVEWEEVTVGENRCVQPTYIQVETAFGKQATSEKTNSATTPEKFYSVASLFSGCGGMDLGFTGGFSIFKRQYSRLPFDIVWSNEINAAACRTYRKNLDKKIHCGDIWEFIECLPKSVDVLIGGFPCQDISINGKGAGISGKRSGLYRAMVEAIRITQPKIFVAENVKGLLMRHNAESFAQILKDFGALGYEVSHGLYHAADYGVPQSRERVFIVGTLRGSGQFVPPVAERGKADWMTAKQAIGDLESHEYDEAINHIWSLANRSHDQGNRQLDANKPGYTIRAECHGNIQFHYSLSRRISMREAARIQSFPDDFIFDAKLRETERQIGNAVPPVLAWHIADTVRKYLGKYY